MKKLVLIAAIVMVVLLPLVASAQATDEERDMLEVSINGGLGLPVGSVKTWNDTLGSKTGLGFGGEIGLFLNKDMVLGMEFNYYQMGINTESSADQLKHRLYSSSLFLKRYFSGNSNFSPYVKLNAGLDFPKFATFVTDGGVGKFRELSYKGSFSLGIGAGLFYYTSDFSGIYAEANYHQVFSNGTKKVYQNQEYRFDGGISLIALKAGIRVFFGSGG